MKSRIEVAAAILLYKQLLLITQRLPDSHLPGFWEFPGGKRKSIEAFEECLIRELREELNIEVVVGKLFHAIEYEYPEKIVFLKFFCCRYRSGNIQTLGGQRFRWVNRKQLGNYQFPPANQSILKKLLHQGCLGIS